MSGLFKWEIVMREPWWDKKFLGITRNDWPWVVIGVVIVVLCLSLDWDYIFGLRP